MKLHVLSDLHLSLAGMDVPDTGADVVVLAGDIARPDKACAWARQIRKPALYVAGNHEFYGGDLHNTLIQLRRECAGDSLHVLECDAWEFGGVRFLGTTLWSDFRIVADETLRAAAMAAAPKLVRDFQRISVDPQRSRLFSPQDSQALFDRSAAWLQAQLERPFDGPTVVITHHAPSPRSVHPRFEGSPLNGCFVSDLERLMDAQRVRLWIHGHTHDSFDYTVRGTRVLCNPRGYVVQGVGENPAFDPALVVEV
ncbi:MAG: metallophosphoesterase family protein [Burkholderiaceae bacterium]|nr:metallophosphoesterase family protein [Burkholderiaceae bacterium]